MIRGRFYEMPSTFGAIGTFLSLAALLWNISCYRAEISEVLRQVNVNQRTIEENRQLIREVQKRADK